MNKMTDMHQKAVKRPRRTILHYDANDPMGAFGGVAGETGREMLDNYKKRLWGWIDAQPGAVSSIHWDACFEDEFAFVNKSSLPPIRLERYQKLIDAGIDLYQEYVDGCRARGLECILTHRISGTDLAERQVKQVRPECSVDGAVPDLSDRQGTPMKRAHPEYYINDWMRMQNLAVPEIREMKLKMLTECLENYAFDGVEIDFCRHTPFLEPGRQWELREHVTGFMRSLREMTLRIEREQNRPVLLSARVPQTVEGCHIDGLDIEVWAEEGLVDTLTLGSRSFEVDIRGFRRATRGRVRLFPCFDIHHQSDAYAEPELAVHAGVFANWWEQGADGVVLFNLTACDWETYRATAKREFREFTHHDDVVLAISGDPERLWGMDKTYVVERRGGYPWENGFANCNCEKQLPLILSNQGKSDCLTLYAGDAVAQRKTERVRLTVLAYGLEQEDELRIALNGTPLSGIIDRDWADPEIIPLGTELISGYHREWLPERSERFARIECAVDAALVHKGENYIELSVRRGGFYPYCSRVEIERVELSVRYART